ncbi:outer membrane beta-barrel protein [Devosia sp. YIM 151766]|uniref:outer membrane beta-barrel protein n=1 Tax=Devosia sp. YIM 151766 TaxID=3017325 RepID=UPI00255D1382|nr:outer membrane beta-barrel protein [Devosia sp. YIM 151766]WIY52877.1 outer membrane beta-barrel protein [Devosia sp. YIM 151766]
MAGRNWTLLLFATIGLLPAGVVLADPPGPDGPEYDSERLQPGLYPVAPGSGTFSAGSEPAHPPFHFDWSVGLKGAYTSSSTEGGSFLTTLNPAFTAKHDGRRADLVIEGTAEMARPWDDSETLGLTALRLGLSANMALDKSTSLSGAAALDLRQPLPNTPGLDPLIAQPPQILSGSAGLGVDRSFGKVNLGLKTNLERTIHGPTIRTDTGSTDNSDQNLWQADTSLRAGVQITPIFEVFGEAALGRDMFDAASPALGVRTDATSTALRGGIAGSWNGVISASASIGLGHHNFDAAGLADITAQLYDASLVYSPNSTVNLAASLATNIEPTGADAKGTARVTHVATAKLDYTVNSWLRLRASTDWGLSVLEGNGEIEHRRGFGAGADYVVNAHTALSAEYAFAHRDNSNSGLLDTHSIGVGITLKR